MRDDEDESVCVFDRSEEIRMGDDVRGELDPGEVLDILVELVDLLREGSAVDLRNRR